MHARRSLVAWLALALAACGVGGGTEVGLPPGPETAGPPGNVVLYAAMSRTDRVEAYRLGTDGLLPREPFDFLRLGDNPRRLTVNDGILYVALAEEIVSIRLGADGSLPAAPTGRSPFIEFYDPHEMIVANGMLYVASAGFRRIDAYILDEDGDIPADIDSAVTASADADYRAIVLNGEFLYAASPDRARIDTIRLEQDGSLPLEVEVQEPDPIIGRPDDLVVKNGVLYVTSGDERIEAYIIRADGLLNEDEDSQTGTGALYSELIIEGDTIYGGATFRGRIDVFDMDPTTGMFDDNEARFSTFEDPTSKPTAFRIDGGVLYVAQAGANRIDAYLLDGDGTPTLFPSGSTRAVPGSFPTDIEIFHLP